MTSSTTKRAVVHRFDREPLQGYVNPQSWLTDSGVELLSPDGALLIVPYQDVKVVCFVKDLDGDSIAREKRLFSSRPKTAGLWVRAQFRDNDFLEGVMSNNLLDIQRYGFMMVPPDPAANNQRVFVPRAALKDLRVVGVIGARRRTQLAPEQQIRLFE